MYEVGFHIPEGGSLLSNRRENLIIHSINRLGTVAETYCVSFGVRTGVL
jgi:hypothetical protein